MQAMRQKHLCNTEGEASMTPIPTLHLRFVERQEIAEQHATFAITRTVSILQQFWEHPDGKEVCGDMFKPANGTWRDIPKVEA
jgi:hypothetical protein